MKRGILLFLLFLSNFYFNTYRAASKRDNVKCERPRICSYVLTYLFPSVYFFFLLIYTIYHIIHESRIYFIFFKSIGRLAVPVELQLRKAYDRGEVGVERFRENEYVKSLRRT